MLIEAFEAILREIVLAMLWLSAAILALSVGSSVAVYGIGAVLRARVARLTSAPAPAALCPPEPTEHP